MQTLYIHIGMPKTGTSALQSFFTQNRERLYEDGIWYPDLRPGQTVEEKQKGFGGNAIFLSQYPENLEDMNKEQRQRFEDTCKNLQSSEKDILLSSEWFFENNASTYKKFMNRRFNVKIIVYLRRQDLWGESSWNQAVKEGKIVKGCFDFIQRRDLDYYKKLKGIATVVGKDNVIVSVYEPGKEEDIFTSFLHILGIHNSENYQKDTYQVNPSLSANYVEIKRIINSIPNGAVAIENMKELLDAGRKFALTNEKTVHAPSFLRREERLAIIEKYHESNTMLAREFLGRDNLFDETIDDSGEYGIDQETIYRDIIRFFGMLFVRQYEEIEKIKDTYKFKIPEECVGKRIVVYGIDSLGNKLYRQLKEEESCKEVVAVDLRPWHIKRLYNIPVEDPEMICFEDIDYVMIAVKSEKAYESIRNFLIDIKKFMPQKICRMQLLGQ